MSCDLSLHGFHKQFPTEQACRNHLQEIRWGPDRFECPQCGEDERWHYIETVQRFECYACHRQTSVTAGTLFQDTKLDLRQWFLAAYLILTSKKGTTVPRLADRLGVTHKTAHNLRHKLLRAIQHVPGRKLEGLMEADETYLGGVDPGSDGRGTAKALVQGWVENRLEHAGRLALLHRPNASKDHLSGDVEEIVDLDTSMVHTDGWAGYEFETVGHHAEVIGDRDAHEVLPWVHVVFANLDRVVTGVHGHVSEAKLQAFLDLFVFRFNHRNHLEDAFWKGLRGLVCGSPWRWEEIAHHWVGPVAA